MRLLMVLAAEARLADAKDPPASAALTWQALVASGSTLLAAQHPQLAAWRVQWARALQAAGQQGAARLQLQLAQPGLTQLLPMAPARQLAAEMATN
jgi:hypothetical protein